ncbi:MAG: NAD(+)/NADH kinase [Christensenellales bacterium]|jgi:NAD+ kinase
MRIGIFSNEIKDKGNNEALKLSEMLTVNGAEVFLFNNTDRPYLKSIISDSDIDLLTVLGGDGTILGVVPSAAMNDVPIIGINMGQIGFLTELEIGNSLSKLIDDFGEGRYNIDSRTLIEVSDKTSSYLALNEVFIGRNQDCCVVPIDVMIDDTLIDRYIGDGVIICTPTGSTAYSLSAGGPILSPDIEAFVINPVCPHSLHSRPIVIADKHTLTLKLQSDRMTAKVSLDGRVKAIIDNQEEIKVKKADIRAKFIRFNNLNFYKRLLVKLNYWSSTEI